MLREIGARSIDDLFSHIPAEYRLRRELKVPGALAESEIMDYFRERSGENAAGFGTFLGAGAYSHYRQWRGGGAIGASGISRGARHLHSQPVIAGVYRRIWQ